MRTITHYIHENVVMSYEYDIVVEFDNNGHITNQYKINETSTYKRRGVR